ncbi:hypothetical protein GCM10027569_89140 [Flindersiella endophytica]
MGERRNHPPTLRESGRGMSDVGDQVRSEWEAIKPEVGDVEGLFGDGQDDVGGMLRSLYEVVLGAAERSFTSGADDYSSFGKALTKMGDNHEETEQRSAKLLGKIQAAMESAPEGKG